VSVSRLIHSLLNPKQILLAETCKYRKLSGILNNLMNQTAYPFASNIKCLRDRQAEQRFSAVIVYQYHVSPVVHMAVG
jgi:hypothetical protein